MQPTDITVEILKEIRDKIGDTNTRLDSTNARIDGTNARLEDTRVELKAEIGNLARRMVESEVRTTTAITDLGGTLRDVRDLLREQHDLRPRVERCEHDIVEIRRRLPRRNGKKRAPGS